MTKLLPISVLILVGFIAYYEANSAPVFPKDIYSKGIFIVQVIKSKRPVVLYFYSDDKKKCSACEWVRPQLNRIMERKGDSLVLAVANVDVVPGFVDEFGIKSLPTVLAFNKGELVEQVDGAQWGKIVNLVNKAASLE